MFMAIFRKNTYLNDENSMRYPSQFACQTGEVKKINPMMEVH